MLNTRLVLDKLSAFELGLFRACTSPVSVEVGFVLYLRRVFFDKRVFGRDNHKRNAEQSVGSGGVNAKFFICSRKREIDKRTRRFAYPMLLLQFCVRQIIDFFKSLQKFIRIFGYAQIPNVL